MLYFEDFEVGAAMTAGPYELAEEEILGFAQRRDPQPWHVDREAALRSSMRGITASSAHSYSIAALLLNQAADTDSKSSVEEERRNPFHSDVLRSRALIPRNAPRGRPRRAAVGACILHKHG